MLRWWKNWRNLTCTRLCRMRWRQFAELAWREKTFPKNESSYVEHVIYCEMTSVFSSLCAFKNAFSQRHACWKGYAINLVYNHFQKKINVKISWSFEAGSFGLQKLWFLLRAKVFKGNSFIWFFQLHRFRREIPACYFGQVTQLYQPADTMSFGVQVTIKSFPNTSLEKI